MGRWLFMMAAGVWAVVAAGCAAAPPASSLLSYQGQDGGLQFMISPADAQIYIDGDYKGLVHDFQGDNVLFLAPGYHALEVRRDGYLTFFRQAEISQRLVEVYVYAMMPDSDHGPIPQHRRK